MTVDLKRNTHGAIICGGNKHGGAQCGRLALRGSNPPRCSRHSGKTRARAQAEATIRLELAKWSLPDTDLVDPAQQFLRLITQSAIRAGQLSELLQAEFMDKGIAGLIGVAYTQDADGQAHPTAEYIRGLTRLEMDERKLCADWCAKALAAGIEERRVRLAERQFDLMDRVLRAVLLELGHDPDSPDVRRVVSSQILQLTS